MDLTIAAGSVTGNHYRENYDAFLVDPALSLAVVADGMGDGPGSAFASRTSVGRFAETLREAAVPHSPAALRQTVAALHNAVRKFARDHPGLAGCTLTALIGAAAGEAWVVQIGDSRLYRLRHGRLELLTSDHTAAWTGLLHGWFTPDSAEAHAARYRLARYIGHPDAPEPDVLNVSLHPGDVYLLCTDGVADQLTYEQIGEALRIPSSAVDRLLELTLTAGGTDNATAVTIQVG
jgi:serine/threonine protein phosphatase PrpC